MAALAAATLIVEAGQRSSVLAVARAAGELGRRVYGVPGPIHSVTSKGVLTTVRAAGLIGRVRLVLTSLRTAPYRATGPDHDPVESALAELATTLLYCEPLLRSGGHVAVVVPPRRHPDGSLVDLTTPLLAAGTSAGLAPVERCIALSAGLRGNRLVTRASLAERRTAARARAAGAPTALSAHHEVLVFGLAHDVELAAEAAGVPWPIEDQDVRAVGSRAANDVTYGSWGRAA